ncbi:uncharacterized protein LOC132202691 [Neocloeon triangulifer]|uniref:uncharacterized protein LOC132202691 n=1 Tax=Neocloeon triangulifer TaxID=2078957 RepID=UPI00286EEE80|nr:uncharacterized protein LOC132202691 [Neocloeon triangulifer]
MADESQIFLQYFKVRRTLNMISGVCFLLYVIVIPAVYFSISSNSNADYSYILYAPLMVCLFIQIGCGLAILHYRRKCMRQIAANAVNYTQIMANAQQGAGPYQQASAGQSQTVYVLPPSAIQQLMQSNRNVASFPSAVQDAPPSYSQVVSNEQPGSKPPSAGWVVPPQTGSSSSLSLDAQPM